MSRCDQIKPSRYFEKNSDRPSHDVPLEDVAKVIEQPEVELLGKPVHIFLSDNRLIIEPLNR